MSKEPLGPVAPLGDDQWFNIVKWTVFGTFQAEELGITSENIDSFMTSEDPVTRRLLGIEGELGQAQGEDMAAIRASLAAGIKAVEECATWIVATYAEDIKAVHAGSVPFLKLMGIVCGGWQMARAALVAQSLNALMGSGDCELDSAAIVKVVERMSGFKS